MVKPWGISNIVTHRIVQFLVIIVTGKGWLKTKWIVKSGKGWLNVIELYIYAELAS